jgi:poly(3-hydroxybutyrate) depolymerase
LPNPTRQETKVTPHRPESLPSRRPDFAIASVRVGDCRLPVTERIVADRPFSRLLHFERPEAERLPRVALVAPLSTNFAYVLRDTVLGLLPHGDVHVIEWRDGRETPAAAGGFGFDDNVDDVVQHLRALPPGTHLLGVCQSVVPSFAVGTLLAQANDDARPASLILIAGPIDSRINPTRVAQAIRGQSLERLERALSVVAPRCPGAGRRVYGSETQCLGLLAYLHRHMTMRRELWRKVMFDDGEDPLRHPFLNHFLALMDIPAEVFLDTMRLVYHEAALPQGRLCWRGMKVEPDALVRTPLLTIEGEEDDIAAVGQTAAAHDLARRLPASLRGRHVQPKVGHFGTFHGAAWRRDIVPLIVRFIAEHDAGT